MKTTKQIIEKLESMIEYEIDEYDEPTRKYSKDDYWKDPKIISIKNLLE